VDVVVRRQRRSLRGVKRGGLATSGLNLKAHD
jgi:hypothetical protein